MKLQQGARIHIGHAGERQACTSTHRCSPLCQAVQSARALQTAQSASQEASSGRSRLAAPADPGHVGEDGAGAPPNRAPLDHPGSMGAAIRQILRGSIATRPIGVKQRWSNTTDGGTHCRRIRRIARCSGDAAGGFRQEPCSLPCVGATLWSGLGQVVCDVQLRLLDH